MTQPSFDQQLATVRDILQNMRDDPHAVIDSVFLNDQVAALCEAAKHLPSLDRPHAIATMETLFEEITFLIEQSQQAKESIIKKLDHVRPHKSAVAAFLKASKTD